VDFNQLYFDHQLLAMSAQHTQSSAQRHKLQIKASAIAECISRSQYRLGAAAAPRWRLLAGR